MINLFFLFIFLSNYFFSISFGNNVTFPKQTIHLTSDNLLILKGEITNKLASTFIYELNQKISKKDLIIYLDTNGGSVDAGNKIIDEVKKYKLNCVANKAISMGFAILQSCNRRYLTDYATLMQHQMSYGIVNEKEKIESYVNYIKQIDDKLSILQAKKIGMKPSKFKKKTYNDWWLFGENAILENCADEIVDVQCNSKLTSQNYTIDNGMYTYIYSKCPLIPNHIDKKKNKNNEEFIFYF